MGWLSDLFLQDSVARSVLILSFVIAGGILLGKVKIFGISLGITFVLFLSLFVSHFGFSLNHEVLHFMKEFGLILFVYSVGLQVGPGFIASFKRGGIKLNLLAIGIVLMGVICTVVIQYFTGIPMQTMVGILSGAVTNTPGLGAAQQAYYDVTGVSDNTIAMGYAVAYPLAVVGIILSIILIRYLFKIKPDKELNDLKESSGSKDKSIELTSIQVGNPEVFGKTIGAIRETVPEHSFVVSRVLHTNNHEIEIACHKTILNQGDKIYVATTPANMDKIVHLFGNQIDMKQSEWDILDNNLVSRRILITKVSVSGKQLKQLDLRKNFGVNITRVNRAGVDLIANPTLALQVGDRVTVVGDENAIKSVEKVLGNQLKRLREPNLMPIFVGIFLGVLVGCIPFHFPGIPQPVKLGLAGGPLIIAILISIIGPKFHFVTYTTMSANLMLREIGICIFLACVGFGAGGDFVSTIVNQGGWQWIGIGFVITIVPLLTMGIIARTCAKLNYYSLMGLLAGSTTDPPALAFANSLAANDAPSVAYATVYPLTMFLRVLSAQLLILLFV